MSDIGLFDAIYTARAIRYLRPDPVPQHIITEILSAGVRAPSASNLQNWLFVVVTDPARRARIAEIYRDAGEILQHYRKDESASHIDDRTFGRLMSSGNHLIDNFHNVPVHVVVASRIQPPPPEVAEWSEDRQAVELVSRQLGAAASVYPAVQNMLLACRALGLGSVMTTLANRRQEDMRAAVGLPDDVTVYALLPIGYPAEGKRHGPVRRRPLGEVAFLDEYGQPWPIEPAPYKMPEAPSEL